MERLIQFGVSITKDEVLRLPAPTLVDGLAPQSNRHAWLQYRRHDPIGPH